MSDREILADVKKRPTLRLSDIGRSSGAFIASVIHCVAGVRLSVPSMVTLHVPEWAGAFTALSQMLFHRC